MTKLKSDPELCIGCGLCAEICPTVFEIRENKSWLFPFKLLEVKEKLAVIKNPNVCDICDCVLVVDSCPVAALSFENKEFDLV
jgi:ferredoxin